MLSKIFLLKSSIYFSSTLSIIFILFSLTLFTFVSVINKRVHHSLPYRLTVIILFGDLVFDSVQLVFDPPLLHNSKILCILIDRMYIISISFSMLYVLTIGLVYLLSIVYNYKPTKLFKILIYTIPILITLILVLLGSIFQERTKDVKCDYSLNPARIWFDITHYTPVIITVALCPIFYIYIIIYIIIKRTNIMNAGANEWSSILKTYYQPFFRMSGYILLPVLGYLIDFIYLILDSFSIKTNTNTRYILYIFNCWLNGVQGFFNSLLFLSNTVFLSELDLVFSRRFDYSGRDKMFAFVKLDKLSQ